MGMLVGVVLGVGDGDAVAVGDGDGVGDGVAVLLGLAGAAVMVTCGVDVAVTGGDAQLNTNDPARAMRRESVAARRILCSSTVVHRALVDRDLRKEA
jgi:hypothetical protein